MPRLLCSMLRRTTTVALIGFVAAVAAASLQPPTGVAARKSVGLGQVAASSLSSSTYEERVRYRINLRRDRHGLRHLRFQRCTDRRAESWADKLVTSGDFFHQDLGRIISRCNATYAGETIGKGSISPRRLVKNWMNSAGHRSILLSRHPRRIGIGSYLNGNGKWVTVADFTRFG